MAKSWLESFLEKESAYAQALRQRGSQALDEASALASGFTDETFQLSDRGFSSLNDALARSGTVDYLSEGLKAAAGAPFRALDRISSSATGRPLISSSVDPGISEGESRKADAKLKAAMAEEAMRRNARDARIAANIEDLKSRSRAGTDVFVSGPETDGIVRGDMSRLTEQPRRGSLSKTKMVDYGAAEDVLPEDSPVPAPLRDLLNRLGRAKSDRQAEALKLVVTALAKGSGRSQDPTGILMALLGSKGGVENVDIAKAALRSIGQSDDEIEQLMAEFSKGSK